MELTFFLVQVFNKSSAAFLHFVKATLQAHPVRSLIPLAVLDFVACYRVLRVPHVVCDEFFDTLFPGVLEFGLVHVLNFFHESIYIFNQDVVSRD